MSHRNSGPIRGPRFPPSIFPRTRMARIPILKKDGTPTNLFWSSRLDGGQPLKTVYRTGSDGRVQRAKSLRFDVRRNTLRRV